MCPQPLEILQRLMEELSVHHQARRTPTHSHNRIRISQVKVTLARAVGQNQKSGNDPSGNLQPPNQQSGGDLSRNPQPGTESPVNQQSGNAPSGNKQSGNQQSSRQQSENLQPGDQHSRSGNQQGQSSVRVVIVQDIQSQKMVQYLPQVAAL